MVVGTLAAGAITVWLANQTGVTQTPVLITSNIVSDTMAAQEPETFVGLVTEANFRISHERNGIQHPMR
jgi:hypothetical protein